MPKTANQKAKRKAKRKLKKAVAKKVVKNVLVGHGDYRSAKKKSKATVSNNTGARILRGKGDFIEDIGNGVANVAGGLARTGVSWLANKARGWLGSLFGSGDYSSHGERMQANSLWANAPVSVVSESSKPNIFRMREALVTLRSKDAFTLRSFSLNPGLATTFPWLSVMARNYTQWKIHGAVLEYRKNCTQLQTAAQGRVLFSVRYDTSQPAPTDVSEVENQAGSVPGVPYENMLMPIECKPSMVTTNKLNLRSGDLPPDQALQLYDHCILDVSNMGCGSAYEDVDIGTVYLAYDVELLNPVLASHDYPIAGIFHASAYDCSTVEPDNHSLVRQADFPATWDPVTRKVTLPVLGYDASYFVSYTAAGESGCVTSGDASATITGMSDVDFFADENAYGASPFVRSTGTQSFGIQLTRLVAAGATATIQFISPTMTAAKVWGFDCVVLAVPNPIQLRTKRDRVIWDAYNRKRRELALSIEDEDKAYTLEQIRSVDMKQAQVVSSLLKRIESLERQSLPIDVSDTEEKDTAIIGRAPNPIRVAPLLSRLVSSKDRFV